MKPSDLFHSVQDFRNEQILRKIKKKVERECKRSLYSFNVADQPDTLLQLLSAYTANLCPYNLKDKVSQRKESIGYLICLPKHFQPPLDTLDFSKLPKIEKSVLVKYFAGKMTYRELQKSMSQYSNIHNVEISFAVMNQFDATDFIRTYTKDLDSPMTRSSFLVGHDVETPVYEVTPNIGVILPYIKGRVYRKIPGMPRGFDIQGVEPRKVNAELKLRFLPATLTLFK